MEAAQAVLKSTMVAADLPTTTAAAGLPTTMVAAARPMTMAAADLPTITVAAAPPQTGMLVSQDMTPTLRLRAAMSHRLHGHRCPLRPIHLPAILVGVAYQVVEVVEATGQDKIGIRHES
jgi:hypothetical protein